MNPLDKYVPLLHISEYVRGGLIGITHVKEGFNCLLEEGMLVMLLKLFFRWLCFVFTSCH